MYLTPTVNTIIFYYLRLQAMKAALYALKNTFRIPSILKTKSLLHLRTMSSTNLTSPGIAAVVQLNCTDDKNANFEQAKKLLLKAKGLGAQVEL